MPVKTGITSTRTRGPVPLQMADAGKRHPVQELGVLIVDIERLGREHQEEPGAEQQPDGAGR